MWNWMRTCTVVNTQDSGHEALLELGLSPWMLTWVQVFLLLYSTQQQLWFLWHYEPGQWDQNSIWNIIPSQWSKYINAVAVTRNQEWYIYRNKFIHQLHRLEKIKTLSHDSYKRLYLMKIEKVHIIFLSLALWISLKRKVLMHWCKWLHHADISANILSCDQEVVKHHADIFCCSVKHVHKVAIWASFLCRTFSIITSTAKSWRAWQKLSLFLVYFNDGGMLSRSCNDMS